MEQLFSSGRIADVILALMLAEGVVLTIAHRFAGIGPEPKTIWTNLFAGAALVLALKSALIGDGWQATSICLAAGLLAHGADLYVRWRS